MDNWRAKDVARLLSLVEAERRYFQEIVAALPAAIAVVDEDRSLVTANRAFRALFSLERSNEPPPPLDDAVPLNGLGDALGSALTKGSAQSWLAEGVELPSGTRTLSVFVAPFQDWDESARPQALLMVEDVTAALAEAKREAETARAELRARLDALPAIAWRLDPSSARFVEVNGLAAARLGLPRAQWRAGAMFWSERIHPDDIVRLRGLHQEALGGAPPEAYEYRTATETGETRWLRDVIRIQRDAEGEVSFVDGATTDVTDALRRTESGHRARKAEALARLAAHVVHEGNNLLTVLGGYGEDLLHSLPPDNALRVNAQEILHAGDRLSALLAQLAPSAVRPPVQRATFRLDPFVAGVRESLQPSLRAGVEMLLDLRAPESVVDVDPERLGELMGTLVRRACDSMARGGLVTFSTRSCETGEGGRVAILRVTDNGAAIHPEALDHMFEPALSAEESRHNLAPLYLSIMDNGGDIDVTSLHERGTRFTITLPEASPAGVSEAMVAEPPAARPATSSGVVLVVEDEAGIRSLIRKTLERSGFTVIEAASAREALELATAHEGRLDLLLSDVVMPEMGGVELARNLIALRPETKVLFISGYTGPTGAETAAVPGAAFLQKPFTLVALLAKMKNLLSSDVSSGARG
jgi:PAS domain S-box-containing protein